jgi:peptide/nickel transport system substrate-binding protein
VPGDGGDAMTVTWKLRDGLKWSDGEALTCDDYKYTFEWVMDPDNTGLFAGTSGYEDIKKFDCTDPTTIVMHFGKIYEGYIATIFPVPLPKHYMEKFSIKEHVQHKGMSAADMPKVPVSGPFKYESVTPGSEIRLVKNDNYTNPWDQKPANLDTLIFKWYGDADAMIAAFKSGEFDIGTDLNDADLPKLADIPDQTKQLNSLTYEFLRPNWDDKTCSPNVTDRGTGCPASDPAFREAIRWAVNKEQINSQLLGGAAALGFTNVSPFAWFYSDPPTYTFDPEKAKSVLEAAGWTDSDGDGIREKGGLKAKIELCTTTRQVRQDTLALISSWLKDVGIDSVVNPVSPDDIFASFNEATDQTPCNLAKGHFDVAEHAFSVPLDPLGNYPTYHSSQFEPKGGNDAKVKDTDVDRILDGVKGSVDFAKIKDLMGEWQEVYVNKTIEIPLYFRKEVYVLNPKVGNFTGNPTSTGPTWNTYDWFVNQ